MDFLNEERCAYCGSSESIIDAVTDEEVIKLCRNCATKNGFPVIVKVTQDQINKAGRFYNKGQNTVVSSTPAPAPSIRPVSHTVPRWVKNTPGNSANSLNTTHKTAEPQNTESLMSKIARAGNNSLDVRDVERVVYNIPVKNEEHDKQKPVSYSHAYSSKIRESGGISGGVIHGSKPLVDKTSLPVYGDLVDNFHWHIQHGRRLKKVSQKQLSEMIAEKEEIVVLAEQGKLPEDYNKLVNKLEQFLNIRIKKKQDESFGKVLKTDENEEGELEEETSDKRDSGFLNYFKSFKSWWNNEGSKEEEANSEKDEAKDLKA